MSSDRATIVEDDLHAFVDGVLPEARRGDVEAYLARRPEEAARVRAWQAERDALRSAYGAVVSEPIPARLAARRREPSRWLRALAAALLLAVGASLGWSARAMRGERTAVATESLPRLAAIAHAVYSPEVRHPVEVGADDEAHLVAWLSKRVGTELRPPRLTEAGYELMGGRLLPGDRGPVAQFMYADAAGSRLTLYAARRPANRETAFRFAQEGPVGVFYWVDGAMGYALSGEIPRSLLARAADLVYAQLDEARRP